ncbi:MAG TPA: ligase-associated DNA damage response exonuclease [Steroidobacteraceae bacterium]|nr:ligase-associated DNA damage response exonuclease [Steroidobacteraceae bacterium]
MLPAAVLFFIYQAAHISHERARAHRKFPHYAVFEEFTLIITTENGLYCPAGDFYIDPWRPVPKAVLTHAHGDHARAGSAHYFAEASSEGVLRQRLGMELPLTAVRYGERFQLGSTTISLHSAGHVLGSAQIRIEGESEVWVVTGDYKRAADPTCMPFEPITCDVLISEATFALPCYRWPDTQSVVRDIWRWWQGNRELGRASVLFCYAFGKAQRVLSELMMHTDEAVYAHGAVLPLIEQYRNAGVQMLPTEPVIRDKKAEYRGALVIAPPSASGTPWMRRFGNASTGFCSGWMRIRGARRRRGYDRGFVLSDHADWPALIQTIEESRAKKILLTHGYSDALVRYLRERGTDAASLRTSFGDEA